MWICKICSAESEDDTFEACWKCSSSRYLNEAEVAAEKERVSRFEKCLRCETRLEYLGTRSFHEGPRLGMLGNFAELFVNKEHYDVYACPRCGKVEFYIDGIGDELRRGSDSVKADPRMS